MMQVSENLYVGDDQNCFYDGREGWAVVHACKSPCHQAGVSYRGNLPSAHPNYLILKRQNHLFLNMVDMDQTLLHRFAEPIMITAMDFIGEHIGTKNILIHRNLGQSRSPALALLYLAKRLKSIRNDSYQNAKEDFIRIYPNYASGRGVETYLIQHWENLN